MFIHKDRIEITILRCHLACFALDPEHFRLQSPSRRANTPLPCNGGFRPKLLESILLPFARPSAAHEVLPLCRPFPSSGLSSRCAVQILFRLIGLIALYTLFS